MYVVHIRRMGGFLCHASPSDFDDVTGYPRSCVIYSWGGQRDSRGSPAGPPCAVHECFVSQGIHVVWSLVQGSKVRVCEGRTIYETTTVVCSCCATSWDVERFYVVSGEKIKYFLDVAHTSHRDHLLVEVPMKNCTPPPPCSS